MCDDVHGLTPPGEIMASFERFGSLVVDWPHKAEMRSYFPPKGWFITSELT